MRCLVSILMLVMLFMGGLQLPAAQAYSYGDPNEEAVAEAYKKVVAELNKTPSDYEGAKTAFESVREEITMHMGAEPVHAVLSDLTGKDKDKAIKDLQKILVLNIARRLESIDKDFENFKDNKLLIAKANATYEALSPQVKVKDETLDAKIRGEFEKALESLGNPGLFGVGVKEPNKASFSESKKLILEALQTQFELKSLEVGHFADVPQSDANSSKRTGYDPTELRNWIPLAIIVILLALTFIYARRRKRNK